MSRCRQQQKTGTVVGKGYADKDSVPEAGGRGRAETEHTVTVAAGICGRSPWPTPVTGPCGCPSRDGPPRLEKARMQRDSLTTTPIRLEQYMIISTVGHQEAAKDVTVSEAGSRGFHVLRRQHQREPLPTTPSSLEQYIIISTVGHKKAAKDVTVPEAGSRGRAETEHTVTVAAVICGRSP